MIQVSRAVRDFAGQWPAVAELTGPWPATTGHSKCNASSPGTRSKSASTARSSTPSRPRSASTRSSDGAAVLQRPAAHRRLDPEVHQRAVHGRYPRDRASGRTVRVPVASASAFGALPIPQFLFGLARNRLPADLVRYEEPATFVVSLDRFLPSFVDADIQKIWIIDGGLAVTLGRGGADLPPSSEESHG